MAKPSRWRLPIIEAFAFSICHQGPSCTIPVKQAKLAFAPNGKILLTIDQAGQAALWDVAKGSKIRDLEGQLANSDFRLVGFSANGKTIAVLDGGWQSAATVVVWHAGTGHASNDRRDTKARSSVWPTRQW